MTESVFCASGPQTDAPVAAHPRGAQPRTFLPRPGRHDDAAPTGRSHWFTDYRLSNKGSYCANSWVGTAWTGPDGRWTFT